MRGIHWNMGLDITEIISNPIGRTRAPSSLTKAPTGTLRGGGVPRAPHPPWRGNLPPLVVASPLRADPNVDMEEEQQEGPTPHELWALGRTRADRGEVVHDDGMGM
jgi:hypothetical protein